MTILYKRALVLAKIESEFDTDAVPDPSSDAYLVSDPLFAPDITLLERDVVLPSISHLAPIAGRKLGKITFTHEAKSNGNAAGTVEPRLCRLFKACGMSVTNVTGAATVGAVVPNTGNQGDADFGGVSGSPYQQAIRRKITVEIVNVSPIRVRVFADAEGFLDAFDTGTADITVTDGANFAVNDDDGNPVVSLKFMVGSAGVFVGDSWEINLEPRGYKLLPVSDHVDSITLYLYYPDDEGNSLLHKLTGARGTWTLDATGGDFGKFNFTFTGSYQKVIDVAYPGTNAVYEQTTPPQVERANLVLTQNGVDAPEICASKWTIDAGNDIQPRQCVNAPNSYRGVLIVDRKPVLGFDPETVLEGTFPFWENVSEAKSVQWRASIGTEKGNVIQFIGPNVVFNGLTYQNRNSIRAYDVKGAFSAVSFAGNDEYELYFA